ncbi:hypothetical protein Tco_0643830 [Tanacetum coccineum]
MDRLSKRKFVIVCHEKVVRIPLEGDEILRVHGERTQGFVKTLMNTKVEKAPAELLLDSCDTNEKRADDGCNLWIIIVKRQKSQCGGRSSKEPMLDNRRQTLELEVGKPGYLKDVALER